MSPLISEEGIHQLHIFIFVLAVFHVLYSILTMGLGRAKMLRWKAWEKETRTPEYQSSHGDRLCLPRSVAEILRGSVTKVDYLTLRHGFITAHLTSDSKFDFHKYIKRSLQDDFKGVVGISPPLWAFAMIFLLLNSYDSYTYFWLPFVPLIIILLVGTKLQVIIAKLALEIHERHATVQGTPVVQPSNELFWFARPQWILFLIHFTLFQNAFEVALYFWTWWEFGTASCFYEKIEVIIIRVAMGIFVQLLCGYITLPLYALVTQMGSHMKKAIFDDQTAKAVERWHQTARKHRKQNRDLGVTSGSGRAPLVSQDGLHQLHIFIFILAVLHVAYSVLTMALGKEKMRRWQAWEQETESFEYQLSHDPARFRYTHETSFVRQHASFWNRTTILLWIASFFRQFFISVTKVDYLTLRHGFITAHLPPHSKFNFHKYIERSLEDDFKVVVGISPALWTFAMIYLLLNVYGWQTYFWLSFVPLIIILLVGTKLQVIITKMAAEIGYRHAVIRGTPVVQPSDKLFWFSRPHWILFLIHFTLFQNSFQLAFFFWIWYKFGLRSCFHENFVFVIVRVAAGVGIQILCSYITLPLYALVTQMGSHMKAAIFNEQTANAVKRWHQAAKKNRKQHGKTSPSGFRSGKTTPSQGSSPIHLLHKYKTMGDLERARPPERLYHSEYEMSDLEMDSSPPPIMHSNSSNSTKGKKKTDATGQQSNTEDIDSYSADFSFDKL